MLKFFLAALLISSVVRAESKTVSHAAWENLLKNYVSSDGRVDYRGFLKQKNALDNYLKMLGDNPPDAGWSVNQQKAYWINAYNAFTVSLVIQHYPVKSIKDIGGLFKSPWDIPVANIGGKTYTLNQIEHEILRKQFKDPRIHFAIVCASRSCPALRGEAYDADRLDAQLDDQAVQFLADESKNSITRDRIHISKIFDWFKDDFSAAGTVIEFINKYAKTKIVSQASVLYQTYNWSLNE